MSLLRTGTWNPGGGNWIEIVPAVAITTYTRLSTGVAPALVLLPGFSFTKIYCTQGTLQYRESKKNTDNGYLHEIDIKGFSPGDSATKRTELEVLLQYRRFVVRFRDNAGLVRLAGTPVESLLFEYDLDTDAEVPGSRGYTLTFSGTLTEPAAYE